MEGIKGKLYKYKTSNMDIDDELMDIFDDEPNMEKPEIKIDELVFPIIGRNHPDSKNYSNGTGFFINNDGYFVTAAHVVINKEQTYKALIENEEYDFKVILIEYVDKEKQVPPFCKDIAICKIEIKAEKKINYYFEAYNSVGQTLNYSGYKQQLPKVIIERKPVYFYTFEAIDEKLEEERIMKGINSDKRPICENTRSLKHPEGILLRGLSGGPVFNGNCIYGMLIGNEYILSTYIIDKLKQLGIDFKSNNQIS